MSGLLLVDTEKPEKQKKKWFLGNKKNPETLAIPTGRPAMRLRVLHP
jgi:hypothetical protein